MSFNALKSSKAKNFGTHNFIPIKLSKRESFRALKLFRIWEYYGPNPSGPYWAIEGLERGSYKFSDVFSYALSSRSNPSLLFKMFFQGAVRLRVFTMCTSIGGNPPHLSSYFSGKGLTFVHFLYLWFTLVYLSCLYLVIWKLYFSVTFQSWHCSSGHLMKSSKY